MDNDPSNLLVLEGISKGYNTIQTRIEILKQVDFTIRKGDSIAVVGASGIGKSTLLQIIGTLDRPDEGRLLFEGRDLFALDQERLARFRNRSVGFVFQFHHLLQGFTAMENVMIPCLISKMSKQDAEKRAKEILARVGLQERFFHRAEDMSGGEQQRVALARALVLEPLLLLADEPTGNLDIRNSEEIHQLLMELNKELGMTVIVVTHNNDLANLMNQRVTLKYSGIVPLQ
ncbi:MAG: ABC transporter ATP-binding protein [Desulfobacteraceae bacterium]|nr:ABC transporter ATP-binding protein [Desulfobacteraceae bacterium]